MQLYWDLMRLEFRASAHNRIDFLTGLLASLIEHAATLAVLWLVLRQVGALGGWNAAQVAFLYGIFAVSSGLNTLVAGGVRNLGVKVWQGELDSLLVLPVSPFVQLLPQANVKAFGDLVVALVVLITASIPAGVHWSFATVLTCIAGVLCSVLILLGLMTTANALAFWLPYPSLMFSLEQLTEFGRYPLGIYPRGLRIILTGLFPVAFTAYYPVSALTGGTLWLAPLGALAAAAGTLAVAAVVWRSGVKRYEGVGG